MATGNLTVAQWVTLCIMIPTLLIGFLGNLFVIAIVAKKKRNQTPQDVFIFNLAVADFLFVNLTIAPNIAQHFNIQSNKTFYCYCVYPTITVCFVAAMWHITSMAIQRCRVITNPWGRRKLTRRGAIIWSVVNWLCALIITLPLLVVVRPTLTCSESWPTVNHRRAYTAALVALQYVLPLLITAGCYVRMGLYLWRSRVQRTEVNVLGVVVRRDNRNQNKDIIRTLTAIVVTFAVLIFPLQLYWMLCDFGNFKDQAWFETLFNFANSLAMIQSSLNPIIYGTVSKQFRRDYVMYLRHLCICCAQNRRVSCEQSPRPWLVEDNQKNEERGLANQGVEDLQQDRRVACEQSPRLWLVEDNQKNEERGLANQGVEDLQQDRRAACEQSPRLWLVEDNEKNEERGRANQGVEDLQKDQRRGSLPPVILGFQEL